MKKHIALLVFFILFFTSCGGGGGSASSSGGTTTTTSTTTAPSQTIYTSYLLDSAIGGVEYRCGDLIGITGDDGSFRFTPLQCSKVEFRIGKFYLGDINTTLLQDSLKIYPTDILDLPTKDINNTKILPLIQLLQTLDSDQNPTNGITIDTQTKEKIENTIGISELNFKSIPPSIDLNQTILSLDPTLELVSATTALNHLKSTMESNDLNLSTINPTAPIFVNPTTLQQITFAPFSTKTQSKKFKIKGEAGTSIYYALDLNTTDSIIPQINDYIPLSNLRVGSNGYQEFTLRFDSPLITSYNYYIILKDNYNNNSDPISLFITNDTIPPHLKSSKIFKDVEEEQKLFQEINATDNDKIASYSIVSSSEDSRSEDADLFTVDTNGTITFITEPNFDDNLNAVFKVVARVIDMAGNMTDLLMEVLLKNILDNPPKLTNTLYLTSLLEGLPNATTVFEASTMLETDLTIAPDNNLTLSPIYYTLHNHTDIFEINRTTGTLVIKDATDLLFDYESLPNSIDLNISVENNNTHPSNDINTTYAIVRVDIVNKIDTTPKLQTPATLSIPEKSSNYNSDYPIGGILKDDNASDRDLTMTFSITNGNDGSFRIDPTAGTIYVRSSNTLDFETKNEYNLTIRATNTWWDGNTTYDEVNQTIKITNVIDNPPTITLKTLTNSLPESTDTNHTIATFDVNGTINDANITTSYTIKTVRKNGVELVPSDRPFKILTLDTNGTLQTSKNLLNEYLESVSNGTDTVFQITVEALNTYWNGDTGTSNPITFDLNITNVIDTAPIITLTPSSVTIDENTTTGTIISDANTSGTTYDTNSINQYRIVSGNNDDKFAIDQSTGVITLTNTLNWETTKNYTLGINASNIHWDSTEHNSTTHTLSITVGNIIETPPVITGSSTLAIHENIDIGEIIDQITIDTDLEDGKTVDSFTIVGGNGGGKFSLGDIKTDSDTSRKYVELKIANTLDFETTQQYMLDINATNSYGSVTHTITINLIDDVDTNLPLYVIMVEYDDINITTTPSDMFNKIFSQNPPTLPVFGSLNDYFYRVSKSKFLFKKGVETDSTADGVIKVKLAKDHPQSDINRLQEDIKDALTDTNTSIDFSSLDANNDGNISSNEAQFLFVIAGGEATYGDTNRSITATSGSLNTPLTLDGKNVISTGSGSYVIVGEKNGESPASIGLMAHHLGNTALRFPYLNDRSLASYGVGFFGLMGYGYRGALENQAIGKTPINPSAYNILSQGWVYPTTITKNRSNIELIPSNKGIDGFNIVKIPTSDPKIYYLLENRVKTNTTGYDDGFFAMENQAFSGGLALWKINENYQNNDVLNSKLVDFIEYDNSANIDTKANYGVSSSLFHAGGSAYPPILGLPFSISNGSLSSPTNSITIDISFP